MLIAWDVEGTLTTSMDGWRRLLAETARSGTLDELDAFRREALRAGLVPRPGLETWFAESPIATAAAHIALTATPMEFVPGIADWTVRVFGGWFSGVLYLPSPRPAAPDRRRFADKGAFCASLGVDVLVDDEPANCRSAVDAGVGAVLVPWRAEPIASLDDAIRRAAMDRSLARAGARLGTAQRA